MRVLFFGTTGVDKKATLPHFAEWCRKHKNTRCRTINFESDYLVNRSRGARYTQHQFLDEDQREQHAEWRLAWQRLCRDVEGEPGDIFIGLHGCFVRGHYGVRIITDSAETAQFRPDRVITLIDDVYEMWWRTESRARGKNYIGRPTLEQLLMARRVELMVADQVVYSQGGPVPPPHMMISVMHPCETLWNWIYSPDDSKKIVYLSFPISAPRRLMNEGDMSGIEEVNRFIKAAYDRQSRNPNLVLLCPLGIDELPLWTLAERTPGAQEEEQSTPIHFDREAERWNMDTVWPPGERLSPGAVAVAERTAIPLEQLQDAKGMIITDVGWRDYRLVETANHLAVFNPKFKGARNVARSVYREIAYAGTKSIPAHVYQNREYDPQGITDGSLFSAPGTMQASPQELLIIRHETVDDVFRAIEH